MAHVVDGFDNTTRYDRYPFHLWTDGQVWEITSGLDYDVKTVTMRTYLYHYAENFGYKVRTALLKNESGADVIRLQYQAKEDSLPPL